MESGSTQAVLPLVGLAAETVIRDRHIYAKWKGGSGRPPPPLFAPTTCEHWLFPFHWDC
ncbi:MAG: hypothetical protein ACQESR_02945 [Planctomycetota bacterium]